MKEQDSYIFFDKDTAFEGEVSTDHLVLEGVITGDVHASKDVFLKQGSIVQGEIVTKKYLVEEGSVHQGKLRMEHNRIRPADSSAGSIDGKPLDEKVISNNITITLPNGTSRSQNDAEVSDDGDSAKRLW